jgi:hypothetical protein
MEACSAPPHPPHLTSSNCDLRQLLRRHSRKVFPSRWAHVWQRRQTQMNGIVLTLTLRWLSLQARSSQYRMERNSFGSIRTSQQAETRPVRQQLNVVFTPGIRRVPVGETLGGLFRTPEASTRKDPTQYCMNECKPSQIWLSPTIPQGEIRPAPASKRNHKLYLGH